MSDICFPVINAEMYTGPYNPKLLNRAQKKLSEIGAWENTKKANVDAELKRMVVRSFFPFLDQSVFSVCFQFCRPLCGGKLFLETKAPVFFVSYSFLSRMALQNMMFSQKLGYIFLQNTLAKQVSICQLNNDMMLGK